MPGSGGDEFIRRLAVPDGFSLPRTCAPVAWGRGSWPNVDWIEGRLAWTGWEDGRIVTRVVRQDRADPAALRIQGTSTPAADRGWASRVLGIDGVEPTFADPVIAEIAARLPGMGSWAAGDLFDGLIAAIVGQSISLASAAVTERRLAALFHPGIERDGRTFWPLPRPDQLAAAEVALVRTSGVTWRRAEALVAGGACWLRGELPRTADATRDPDAAYLALRALRLVGPWTAESTLLWGLGAENAYPPGDAALLRAARRAYGDPEMTHARLNARAEGWRPHRAVAARLLWLDLLGSAPTGEGEPGVASPAPG